MPNSAVPSPGRSTNTSTFNQKLFDIVAGGAVFVSITLILNDYQPELAYAILVAALGTLILTHTTNVQSLVTNFRSAIGKA